METVPIEIKIFTYDDYGEDKEIYHEFKLKTNNFIEFKNNEINSLKILLDHLIDLSCEHYRCWIICPNCGQPIYFMSSVTDLSYQHCINVSCEYHGDLIIYT